MLSHFLAEICFVPKNLNIPLSIGEINVGHIRIQKQSLFYADITVKTTPRNVAKNFKIGTVNVFLKLA
jgi:hypothetical protein